MGKETRNEAVIEMEQDCTKPSILDEVVIEELDVDGICGIY
jgi:mycofactocin precursor